MTTATTRSVANEPVALSEDSAANAFLSAWSDEDAQELSDEHEETEEELTEEDSPENEETDNEDSDEGDETDHQEDDETEDEDADESEEGDEEAEEKAPALTDDAVVKVKVDGKEIDVSVKDLKRLYGQEQSLTRKTQEVAAKRKEADANTQRLDASYQKLYTKAADKFKPYSEIDWVVAAKQLDVEQLQSLRKEAQEAYDDFRFVSEEADNFVKSNQQQQQANLQVAAKEANKVLKAEIPNWSPALYDQIREFAIGKGLDASLVNNIVDPSVIKILHQARLYEQGKKIATKKKVATPKKVLKSTASTTVKDTKGSSTKSASKFANSGSAEDAADLFLSRWSSDEE